MPLPSPPCSSSADAVPKTQNENITMLVDRFVCVVNCLNVYELILSYGSSYIEWLLCVCVCTCEHIIQTLKDACFMHDRTHSKTTTKNLSNTRQRHNPTHTFRSHSRLQFNINVIKVSLFFLCKYFPFWFHCLFCALLRLSISSSACELFLLLKCYQCFSLCFAFSVHVWLRFGWLFLPSFRLFVKSI